jgi:23S rRNA (pseudouridine1915-N3)-methyltransferase
VYKIKILTIGKTKEAWLDEALAEYEKRLKTVAQIELVLAKNDLHLVELASKETALIVLDVAGTAVTSEEFSKLLVNQLEKGGTRLSFVIGGAEGLPPQLQSALLRISFSKMTFTHQIVRLV